MMTGNAPRYGIKKIGASGVFAVLLTTAVPAVAEPSQVAPEVGWNYGEMETARSTALGGATRAVSSSVTALYSNPANMASAQLYHLEAIGQIWPEANRQSYGIGLVDSITSRLAGGIAANYTLQDGDGVGRKAADVRFGLAYPLGDRVFLGVGGKYLRLTQRSQGPFGPGYLSGRSSSEPLVNHFNVDAGATFKPIDVLAISVVGSNLANPGHGFFPTSLSGGAAFSSHDITVEGDLLADFTTYDKTKMRAMFGGEVLLADHFPLRVGYRYDEGQTSHAIGGGAGYIDQQFGVEAAVRRTVAGEPVTTVVISLQFYVESVTGSRNAAE